MERRDRAGGGGGRTGVSCERSGGSSAHPVSPSGSLGGRCSPAGPHGLVISGVSQFHLRAELGPAVGPAQVVVADAEEPLGEAQGGHQQGDAQEEQHPLAHAGLLLLQVQAQEVDAAVAREGAFRASWAGEARRAGRWAGQQAGRGSLRLASLSLL